ncbi:MAG: AAA family ATPase [Pseudomonadota bacterium]
MLDALVIAIGSGAPLVCLTGPEGAGKSTLAAEVGRKLPDNISLIRHDFWWRGTDVLSHFVMAMTGRPASGSDAEIAQALRSAVDSRDGVEHVVLVADAAEGLPPESLARFVGFVADSGADKRVTGLVAGAASVLATLQAQQMPIKPDPVFTLDLLDAEAAHGLMRRQLAGQGMGPGQAEDSALDLIYRATRGNPRLMRSLLVHCMTVLGGGGTNTATLTGARMREILTELAKGTGVLAKRLAPVSGEASPAPSAAPAAPATPTASATPTANAPPATTPIPEVGALHPLAAETATGLTPGATPPARSGATSGAPISGAPTSGAPTSGPASVSLGAAPVPAQPQPAAPAEEPLDLDHLRKVLAEVLADEADPDETYSDKTLSNETLSDKTPSAETSRNDGFPDPRAETAAATALAQGAARSSDMAPMARVPSDPPPSLRVGADSAAPEREDLLPASALRLPQPDRSPNGALPVPARAPVIRAYRAGAELPDERFAPVTDYRKVVAQRARKPVATPRHRGRVGFMLGLLVGAAALGGIYLVPTTETTRDLRDTALYELVDQVVGKREATQTAEAARPEPPESLLPNASIAPQLSLEDPSFAPPRLAEIDVDGVLRAPTPRSRPGPAGETEEATAPASSESPRRPTMAVFVPEGEAPERIMLQVSEGTFEEQKIEIMERLLDEGYYDLHLEEVSISEFMSELFRSSLDLAGEDYKWVFNKDVPDGNRVLILREE